MAMQKRPGEKCDCAAGPLISDVHSPYVCMRCNGDCDEGGYTLPQDEWDEMTPAERRAARVKGIRPITLEENNRLVHAAAVRSGKALPAD